MYCKKHAKLKGTDFIYFSNNRDLLCSDYIKPMWESDTLCVMYFTVSLGFADSSTRVFNYNHFTVLYITRSLLAAKATSGS